MPDVKAKTPPKKKLISKPGEPVVVTAVNDKHQLCTDRFSPCGKFLVGGGMTGEILHGTPPRPTTPSPLPSYTGHGGWVGEIGGLLRPERGSFPVTHGAGFPRGTTHRKRRSRSGRLPTRMPVGCGR